MRKRALAALAVTVVAVVLLARYETEPPVTVNPDVKAARTPRALATPAPTTPARAAARRWDRR